MKLIVLFDIGDKIEIAEDWRLWRKGDKATVEHITTDTVDGQILTLIADENKEAEKDFNTLLASRCRSVETAFTQKIIDCAVMTTKVLLNLLITGFLFRSF